MNEGVVYRIDADNVQRSSDRGVTWNTEWQVPPGRRAYLAKVKNTKIDLYPHAIAFGPDSRPYVALGTAGVLVRGVDGGWSQQQLRGAGSVPLYPEEGLGRALATNIFRSLMTSWLSLVVMSLAVLLAWRRIAAPTGRRSITRGAEVLALWGGCGMAMLLWDHFSDSSTPQLFAAGVLTVFTAPLPSFVVWHNLKRNKSFIDAKSLHLRCLLSAAAAGLLALGTHTLFDYGVLPSTRAAWGTTGILCLMLAVGLSGWTRQRLANVREGTREAP